MKIIDPVLVPDVSIWTTRTNAKELEDGGCGSVIVGMYGKWENGKRIFNPASRAQCVEVATKSSMILQAYYWVDITENPIEQAEWLLQTIKTEGLPIRWVWSDLEQWWTDWYLWYQFRAGKIPVTAVPRASGATISAHYQAFNAHLRGQCPTMGSYISKHFIADYAPQINSWLPGYHTWVPHWGRQPATVSTMGWEQLKQSWMPNYDIVLGPGHVPNLVVGHQFTGDRIKLPGTYDEKNQPRVLDVSVFDRAFLDGIKISSPPQPPPLYPVYIVNTSANVRETSDNASPIVTVVYKGAEVQVDTENTITCRSHILNPAGWVASEFLTLKTEPEYITCPTCNGSGRVPK